MADKICEIQSNFTKIGIQGFLGMLINMSLAWICHFENRKSNIRLVNSDAENLCKLKAVKFGWILYI